MGVGGARGVYRCERVFVEYIPLFVSTDNWALAFVSVVSSRRLILEICTLSTGGFPLYPGPPHGCCGGVGGGSAGEV